MTIQRVLSSNHSALTLSAAGFADLALTGENVDPGGAVFQINAVNDNAEWGNPEPIDVAVQRWMTDGAVAATQGHDNRTVTFRLVVSALTSVDLAAGEAALALRASVPCSLTWVGPEGAPDAPATVFEVWTWHLDHSFDGGDELFVQRAYDVTMTAKPWVRSAGLTLSPAPAIPGAPTNLSIDTCSSTTNWTGSPSVPTTTGGTIRESTTYFGPTVAVANLTRTASVTGLSALPYLVIDASTTGGVQNSLTVTVDTHSLTKAAQIGTVGYWVLPTGTSSFTTLVVEAIIATSSLARLIVADVSATDTIGGTGSQHQLSRTLAVGGSVPTSGSIHIASPSATILGTCLVYTCPDNGSGYSPPLRQYRTAGNTVTSDATCVSGSHEAFIASGVNVGSGITYTIPVDQLPEGQYVLVGRFLFGASTTLTVTATSGYGGCVGKVSGITGTAGWGVIGALSMPGLQVPAESTGSAQLLVTGTALTGTHTLDELYLLDVSHGAFSLIQYVNTTNLWLDAPDADPVRNRPAIYVGSQPDKSDAVAPNPVNITARGDHDLAPGGAQMLTVTDGVNSAAASASFYHRWHTHAGD